MTEQADAAKKMKTVRAYSESIARLLKKEKRTVQEALQLQQLKADRAELLGTLPPLTLVHG